MKEKIVELLLKPTGLSKEQVASLLEIPPDSRLGDYAFPCFTLAKTLKKSPQQIASEITKQFIEEITRIIGIRSQVDRPAPLQKEQDLLQDFTKQPFDDEQTTL